jgi:arylsulfatase A-like enzyme/Flp pilus assembly protein TadD
MAKRKGRGRKAGAARDVRPPEASSPEPRGPGGARVPRLVGIGLAVAVAAGAAWWWPGNAIRSGPNLLVVTIDTLRADHIGAYGDEDASTPTLDGLAERGVRFTNATSSVPLTGPSHATIFTGVYPPVHGVRDNVFFPLDDSHTTLAERLRDHGYRTAAFVGAYPVASTFGFARGFDHYDEEYEASPTEGETAERSAEAVVDAALGWLREAESPFFAWVHVYDPHAPYAPPPPYDAEFAGRPYDGEIAFTDAQLGRLLKEMERSGLAEETVIAVLADHGESLGEHREATHAILIYQSSLHIPLILAGPGVPRGTAVDARVGTTDLVPTLLGLLGLPGDESLPGRDLRPAFKGEPLPPGAVYAESLFGRFHCHWAILRAWVDGDWKLIEGAEPELYNLEDDPDEAVDLAEERPEELRRLRSALWSAMQRMAPGGDSARAVSVSEEQAERLRSLGYAGGASIATTLDEPGLPDPRDHVHLYDRLKALFAARGYQLPEAVTEAAAIASADPGNPFAHFTLARLAYRHGSLDLARQAFERTLEIDEDQPGIRLSLGRLLKDMGRLEDSERELRISLELSPEDDPGAAIALADTLVAQGRADEAEPLLEGVLEREPRHVEAIGSMGRLYLAQGRTEAALDYLARAAREQAPDSVLALADAQIAAGRYAAAVETTERVLRISSGHPWALALKGHALLLAGNRGEGLELLERAFKLHPRRVDAWSSLAAAFDAAGLPDRAARCRTAAQAIVSG